MADTEFAKLTFSLPEDAGSDQVKVFTASTEDGSYSLSETLDYAYGQTSIEIDDLDVTKYYKIQFYNSVDEKLGPLSEPVYGADWTNRAKPELYVSTSSDGAFYADIQDVYDYTNSTLDNTVASEDRVSNALKRARAVIDIVSADMSLDRYTATFSSDQARRKYNASLQIIKEAEINFALGAIYQGLADDQIVSDIQTGDGIGQWDNVQIGNTALNTGQFASGVGGGQGDQVRRLANSYYQTAAAMMALLAPATVPLRFNEGYIPRTPLERLKYYRGY